MQAAAREDILRRLRTVEGHVAGLSRMVEEDKYCIDVIDQVIAVQRALDQVALKILDSHLSTCVRGAMSDGTDAAEKDRLIRELLAVYRKAASL